MKLVLVEWDDIVTDGGWKPRSAPLELAKCFSVGVLIEDRKDAIVIAQSKASFDDGAHCVSDRCIIPKGCIKRMRKLKIG